MFKKPLISIVTPTYNTGHYLDQCIQSVLKQDYPNIEHIIQDGGSTDNTLNILKKYSTKKIKWVSEKDNGQSDGLNKAIQRSKGDLILVLNADDLLMPYACSWAVENMNKYPNIGAIYGDVYIINEQGNIIRIIPSREYSFIKLLSLELVPPAQASFIRRSALMKVGFCADSKLDTCPDFEMWVRLGAKFPVKHVFGVITKYRSFITPQLDSGRGRTAERFIKAKKLVLDRYLRSPSTPKEIKKMRHTFYAGLYYWGAQTASAFGQSIDSAKFRWISLYYKPAFGKIFSIIRSYKYTSFLLMVDYLIEHSFLKRIYKLLPLCKKNILKHLRVNFEDIDINKVKDYWDERPCNIRHSSSKIYTKKYFDEVEKKKYFVEPHIPEFAQFDKWKNKRVLEIGCGIGTDTINFARSGAQVTAVDLSDESLKIAKRRTKIYGLQNRIKFIKADAERLSDFVKVEDYDLIYSFGVIHHSPHPYKIIQEIKKYCNEDTIIKIMVYNRLSWKVFWIIAKYGKGMFWNLNNLVAGNSEAANDSPVTYTYTKKSIARLLRGLVVTKVNVDHIFPYEVEFYKKHQYKRVSYFRWIPLKLFRIIEKAIGWHLLVEAKIQT